MPRSSKLSALKSKLAAVTLPVRPRVRDPRLTARVVLGVLIAANLIAALFAFRPWADSPLQLEQQLIGLRKEMLQRRVRIDQLKVLVKKSEQARREGDTFMSRYFLGRRTASSTLVSELNNMAKAVGIRPKEHSFAFEQVEGTDNLAVMMITANYDGTYADLVQYLNKIDRSNRFFILENISAAPQQGGNGVLNINMKVNIFVRDEGAMPLAALAPPEVRP
ncbi:MAG TPA: type 4a pilus biogenesis protein PilO [Bryobacteraceae bacterium]|nr:type 4a pilus biogenesis protein PilO [Bryobacteraceae bacterium]